MSERLLGRGPRADAGRVAVGALCVLLAASATACRSEDGATDRAEPPSSTAAIDGAPEQPARSEFSTYTYRIAPIEDGASETELQMDVYQPPGDPTGRRPVAVVIHGGGFRIGKRSDAGITDVARVLADRGIVAVSIDYRLFPQDPVPGERVQPLIDVLPSTDDMVGAAVAVEDTLAAIDYLHDRADDLGIDPDRLALIGSSAGAITANHVAYVLDDHDIDGPTITAVGSLWGGIYVPPAPDSGPDAASQIDADEAALFIVHGDEDTVVPVSMSDDLAARADAVGVRVEYHRIVEGGHGFLGTQFFSRPVAGNQNAFDRLLAFMADELGTA